MLLRLNLLVNNENHAWLILNEDMLVALLLFLYILLSYINNQINLLRFL